METTGKIRVGRIQGKQQPRIPGFTPIVVMTPSSKYGHLGPYVLKDRRDRLMENIWQFSKVYAKVPYSKQLYSRWDSRVIWEWPAERHVDEDGDPNEAYYKWRQTGMSSQYAIRYPVGYQHKSEVLYSLEGGEVDLHRSP